MKKHLAARLHGRERWPSGRLVRSSHLTIVSLVLIFGDEMVRSWFLSAPEERGPTYFVTFCNDVGRMTVERECHANDYHAAPSCDAPTNVITR